MEQLIFQHLLDKLARQDSYIVSLRNQAGISAAVTELIATFFGTIISQKPVLLAGDRLIEFNIFAVLALVFFLASIAFSITIVVHYREFNHTFNTNKMLLESKNWEMIFWRNIFQMASRFLKKTKNTSLKHNASCGSPWSVLLSKYTMDYSSTED